MPPTALAGVVQHFTYLRLVWWAAQGASPSVGVHQGAPFEAELPGRAGPQNTRPVLYNPILSHPFTCRSSSRGENQA